MATPKATRPRSDSKLKLLTEEQQEQIATWARTPKSDAGPGGLAYAREMLAREYGVKVSLSTLSEFVSWHSLQQRFAKASSRATQVAELLRERAPGMEPEQVRALAQSIFTLEALDAGDAAAYVSLEHLQLSRDAVATRAKLEERKLALAERRVLLLEENAAKAKAALEGIKSKGGLTPETLRTIEEAAGLL